MSKYTEQQQYQLDEALKRKRKFFIYLKSKYTLESVQIALSEQKRQAYMSQQNEKIPFLNIPFNQRMPAIFAYYNFICQKDYDCSKCFLRNKCFFKAVSRIKSTLSISMNQKILDADFFIRTDLRFNNKQTNLEAIYCELKHIYLSWGRV